MIPDNVKEIMQKLLDNDCEAFIIGGAVRDFIINKEPKDFDIFTNASGEGILKLFPKGKVIGSEERQVKLLTVIVDGVEVSQYRRSGDREEIGCELKDHLATCDFTMNAMAMDIHENVIDRYDGEENIRNNRLKCVGNATERFKEDGLRILRGIRFILKYNLKPDVYLHNELKIGWKYISQLPVERVRDELMKILEYEDAIELLYNYNLLTKLIPELSYCEGVPGGSWHKENVITHLKLCYKNAHRLTDNVLLKLACFAHDLGKGWTYKKIEDGRVIFRDHHKVSEYIIRQFMAKYKFSNNEIKYVTTLIGLHMFGLFSKPKKGKLAKFFNDLDVAGVHIEEFILLRYCDNQSNLAKPRMKFGKWILDDELLRQYYKLKYEKFPFHIRDLEIDGKDLLLLGFKGASIGAMLDTTHNLILEGCLDNDKPTLMKFIREVIAGNTGCLVC